eukprot:m.367517 g.367517  ORF g.367517 m.367517 type:complete len:55 (-) comp20834_c0_seq4:121-285(-)
MRSPLRNQCIATDDPAWAIVHWLRSPPRMFTAMTALLILFQQQAGFRSPTEDYK